MVRKVGKIGQDGIGAGDKIFGCLEREKGRHDEFWWFREILSKVAFLMQRFGWELDEFGDD